MTKRLEHFVLICLLGMAACDNGGSGSDNTDENGSQAAFEPGVYSGAAFYTDTEENRDPECLDLARSCYSLVPYRLKITEETNGSGGSRLVYERLEGETAIAIGFSSSDANETETVEVLTPQADCSPTEVAVYCSGTRETRLKLLSEEDGLISSDGELSLECERSGVEFSCKVNETATLQG